MLKYVEGVDSLHCNGGFFCFSQGCDVKVSAADIRMKEMLLLSG